jgi:hypothetical protein
MSLYFSGLPSESRSFRGGYQKRSVSEVVSRARGVAPHPPKKDHCAAGTEDAFAGCTVCSDSTCTAGKQTPCESARVIVPCTFTCWRPRTTHPSVAIASSLDDSLRQAAPLARECLTRRAWRVSTQRIVQLFTSPLCRQPSIHS